jgi:hypothetical protein
LLKNLVIANDSLDRRDELVLLANCDCSFTRRIPTRSPTPETFWRSSESSVLALIRAEVSLILKAFRLPRG